jgi:hypothetical protein
VDATVLQSDDDQKVRQRLRVTRDGENLFDIMSASSPSNSRQRVPRRTIDNVHCAPLERESRRFVLDGWRALARRCVIDAPDVRVSADAGLKPASSRRSYAPRGDDRG